MTTDFTAAHAALVTRLQELKKERQAVILAHNYQLGEVQDVADFLGDSLDLSKKAASTDAKVVVFAGVHFMAETAAILSPEKTVLLPEPRAGCPMADMASAAQLRALKKEHPDAKVICYVNTSAEVKALCDVACTSANAAQIVERFPKDQKIIFVPDQNLGQNVMRQSGHTNMVLWPGCCPIHDRMTAEHVEARRRQFPGAPVVVHPECRPEVVEAADAALSTSGILSYAAQSDAETILIGTELGIMYRLAKENPNKTFVPVTEQAICPDMKLITVAKLVECLEKMQTKVTVPEEIRGRARKAVLRMTGDEPL